MITDDNRISAAPPDEDIAAILEALKSIRDRLPFLVSLTAQQRMELPMMKDKSAAFDGKCAGYMVSHPELMPGFVEVAEVDKDRALRDQVMRFCPLLEDLAQEVESTIMVVNSEIWMADLASYQSARAAARRNRSGAEGIYNDLRLRFPGTPSAPEKEPADRGHSVTNGSQACSLPFSLSPLLCRSHPAGGNCKPGCRWNQLCFA